MYSPTPPRALDAHAVAILEGLLGKEQTLCLQVHPYVYVTFTSTTLVVFIFLYHLVIIFLVIIFPPPITSNTFSYFLFAFIVLTKIARYGRSAERVLLTWPVTRCRKTFIEVTFDLVFIAKY
jgi:hypothetical protein